MSASEIEAIVKAQKTEKKRAEIEQESFEKAQDWVEKNTLPADRCGTCGGVGLEEQGSARYASCETCKGTGKA